MTDEIKNPSNRVDPSHDGKFHAFWHERVVYANGRVKRVRNRKRGLGISRPLRFGRQNHTLNCLLALRILAALLRLTMQLSASVRVSLFSVAACLAVLRSS